VSWFLNGAFRTTSNSYTLSTSGLSSGTYTLAAVARDTTAKVRKDPGNLLSQTRSWTVSVGGGSCSAPPVPTNLTATRLSSSSFRVNWSAAPAATNYDLQRWNGSAWQDHASTANLSYTFTGLTGTQYVRIRARSSCGNSAYSNWVQTG
ncbi:MAG: fibronectin type III domain-containing protein, partial [Gammaproteobacteria bacterium]|nr:fibronectin type III domain-containing protein [Gammaproteobacteria bacterium]